MTKYYVVSKAMSEETQNNVARASNVVGLAAGVAGTGSAYTAYRRMAKTPAPQRVGGPVTGRLAARMPKTRGGKLALAGAAGALALQGGNVIGDAVTSQVLSRASKDTKAKKKAQVISKGLPHLDALINNPQLPKSERHRPTTAKPFGEPYPRQFDVLDRKRYVQRAVGAPLAGAAVGAAATHRLTQNSDPKKDKKRGAALAGTGAVIGGGTLATHVAGERKFKAAYAAKKGTVKGYKRSLCPTGAVGAAVGSGLLAAGATAYVRGKKKEKAQKATITKRVTKTPDPDQYLVGTVPKKQYAGEYAELQAKYVPRNVAVGAGIGAAGALGAGVLGSRAVKAASSVKGVSQAARRLNPMKHVKRGTDALARKTGSKHLAAGITAMPVGIALGANNGFEMGRGSVDRAMTAAGKTTPIGLNSDDVKKSDSADVHVLSNLKMRPGQRNPNPRVALPSAGKLSFNVHGVDRAVRTLERQKAEAKATPGVGRLMKSDQRAWSKKKLAQKRQRASDVSTAASGLGIAGLGALGGSLMAQSPAARHSFRAARDGIAATATGLYGINAIQNRRITREVNRRDGYRT